MLEQLAEIVGKENVSNSSKDLANFGQDWIKDFQPNPSCIIFPRSEKNVQDVVKFCNEKGLKLVPSGGRTGLSGGATATNQEVVLSLSKLNSFIEVNPTDRSLTCEAGVITEKVQQVASANGFYFPIDFASKGSSQIGGNLATNAGGIRVIKYGNIRDWVIGLNVVLPDGTLLNLNGSLFKNQTGYDLKSLIIGSEGTLGIITKVTLKLTTPPRDLVRVLCGLTSLDSILVFLSQIRSNFPDVSAFEYFPRLGLEKVLDHHQLKDPFSEAFPYYVLVELERIDNKNQDLLETFLSDCMEQETLAWVVISQNHRQLQELMDLRELLPETLSALHTLHKNDISVPVHSIPDFVRQLDRLILENYPGFEVVTFGHIGDGNLHINVLKPKEMTQKDFFDQGKKSDHHIFGLVQKFSGSISAEHGVGLLKKPFMNYSRTEKEIDIMRQIKKIFDPKCTLNPGKIF